MNQLYKHKTKKNISINNTNNVTNILFDKNKIFIKKKVYFLFRTTLVV